MKKIYVRFNYLIIEEANGTTHEIPTKDARYDDRGNVFVIYDSKCNEVKVNILFTEARTETNAPFSSEASFLQYLRMNTGTERNKDTNDIANACVTVSPSDANDLPNLSRLYVGTGGDVNVIMALDQASPVVFKNVASGTFLPIKVKRVMSAQTTATNILALW
jgi:hypothetical protein